MAPRGRLAAVALLAALSGCAPQSTPPALPSRAGWIELELVDARIPPDPLVADRPPRCAVEFSLNGEAVVDEVVAARGDAPPYRLARSFRFPATAGRHAATLVYAGCRFVGDQADVLEAQLEFPVREGLTTRVAFDGDAITWELWQPGAGL
jgi:hypothetical protein